jgi:hypothetical protein
MILRILFIIIGSLLVLWYAMKKITEYRRFKMLVKDYLNRGYSLAQAREQANRDINRSKRKDEDNIKDYKE